MSENKILLSILLVAKNDNYTSNYLDRLSYVINFNCQNIKDLGLSGKIIIEIVDWGSEKLLSEELQILDNDFNKMINFIDVNKDITNEYDKYSFGNFFVEAASNVGFRRSNAEFILQCPADQIFSKNSLLNLYNYLLLDKKKNNKFYLLHRKILDDFFYGENYFSFKSLNKFLDNHNYLGFKIKDNRLYYGGGIGGVIVRKEDILKYKGYDENYFIRGRYGGSDALITKKLIKYLNFEEMTSKGICMYKLPYTKKGKRSEQLKLNTSIFNLRNYYFFSNVFNQFKFKKELKKFNLNNSFLDQEMWGLGNKDFSFIQKKIKFNENFLLVNKKRFFQESVKLTDKDIYRLFSCWFEKKDNFDNFLVLINILNCLKKFNIFSFYEIGSSKTNRILSISKLFPFLEIVVLLKKNPNLNNDWFFLSSRICISHKGYFRAVEYENGDLKNLNIQLNNEKFSNFVSIDNADQDLDLDNYLEYINNNKDLIGLILINKKSIKDSKEKLNDDFVEIEYFKNYFLMLNKQLFSEEVKNNYLKSKIKSNKIMVIYFILKILNIFNVYNKLKHNILKSIKKWI